MSEEGKPYRLLLISDRYLPEIGGTIT